jgi:hypothetical protein
MSGKSSRQPFLRLSLLLVTVTTSTTHAQSLLGDLSVVDDPYAELPNCKDHGILQGIMLDTTCADFCAPNTTETFDYADSGEDPHYVIRNTVCRCFDPNPPPTAQTNKTFECWSKAEVWEKKTPIMKCTDHALNITSKSSCENFCSTIDPISFGYTGSSGSSRCSCYDILVCDDVGAASALAVATSFALLLGTLMLLW